MQDLSLHVLDLIQNCVEAGAGTVRISLDESGLDGVVALEVSDDGRGMSPELLARVKDPFTTTRTTRRVGMGIPLIQQAVQAAGGDLSMESREGHGTTIRAWFLRDHIDAPPLGDVAQSVAIAIATNPGVRFVYTHTAANGSFCVDSKQIAEFLAEVSISDPGVVAWLKQHLREGIKQVRGGESQ